jgi:hypothetical protein
MKVKTMRIEKEKGAQRAGLTCGDARARDAGKEAGWIIQFSCFTPSLDGIARCASSSYSRSIAGKTPSTKHIDEAKRKERRGKNGVNEESLLWSQLSHPELRKRIDAMLFFSAADLRAEEYAESTILDAIGAGTQCGRLAAVVT